LQYRPYLQGPRHWRRQRPGQAPRIRSAVPGCRQAAIRHGDGVVGRSARSQPAGPRAFLSAMGDLVRAGKIRYFGVSNYKSWRVAEICAICDRLGIDRPVVSQPYYNAMNRMPEVEHLPACAYYGLGVVRWMQPALVCFGSWQTKISLVPISRTVRHKIRVAVQPPFCARNVCSLGWSGCQWCDAVISGFVESRGGISPPRAPRHVREPLDSYGSRCSAVAMT
jgi:Aldo/keto reductase family